MIDATAVTAIAAAVGSVVGATASITTAWLTQRKQAIHANSEWKLHELEALYKDFAAEASRVAIDAVQHSLERPDQLVTLYGLLSRIRLMSSDEVLCKAEDCCRRIVQLYGRPNMSAEELHAALGANEFDPLKEFSAACRMELLAMSSSA
jgi:hypothetical protein